MLEKEEKVIENFEKKSGNLANSYEN